MASSTSASLKKTFTDIGEQFKTENLGASVEFLMAGSSDLITQLTQGADADVFASADTKTWTRQRRPVCWRQPGELRVVQRPDAARSQRRRVRATSAVRVGYPESRAGHGREVKPGERGVLGFRRPEQGDNRLGRRRLVYVTDAIGAGDKVASVGFPEACGAVNMYPIAVLKGSQESGVGARVRRPGDGGIRSKGPECSGFR